MSEDKYTSALRCIFTRIASSLTKTSIFLTMVSAVSRPSQSKKKKKKRHQTRAAAP
jgi:hypothetical protein